MNHMRYMHVNASATDVRINLSYRIARSNDPVSNLDVSKMRSDGSDDLKLTLDLGPWAS